MPNEKDRIVCPECQNTEIIIVSMKHAIFECQRCGAIWKDDAIKIIRFVKNILRETLDKKEVKNNVE